MREPIQIRRDRQRAEARRRVAALVKVPLSPAVRAYAPTRHAGRKRALAATTAFALVLHGAVVGLGFYFAADDKPPEKEVTIVVRERPAPPPPPVPVAVEEPAPEPEPTPEPPKPEPPPPPKKVATAPPPKPAEPPPPATPPRPPRIGLTLESTTEGGDGPSFATGNTNFGQTDTKAGDPKSIPPGPAGPPGPPGPPAGPNRAATNIPGGGNTVKVPKRTAEVKPAYPELLRAQGIEADVVLLVSIDATGKVTNVKVLTSSGQPEFDAAAVAAARAEVYEPATRDGAPMPYTLKFTTRFRLDNP